MNVHWFGVTLGGLFDRYAAFYSVSYAELPESLEESEHLTVIDDTADKIAASLKGELIREQEISLADHPTAKGLEVEIKTNSDHLARARVFIVGSKLYQLVVTSDADLVHSTEGDRFLDSFQVRQE